MEEAIAQLQAKDTKERMAGVERLQVLLEQSRKSLSPTEVGNLVDASVSLLKDHNFRVCEGALQALASAAALAGEHLKVHFNALLPLIVERLGDGKQPVRDAGRRLLLALMEISSPTLIVERAGNFAWCHKNWRVREEFARTVASATHLFAATELPFQRVLLPSVLQLFDDSNNMVREAAMLCLEEMYRQGGQQFMDELHHQQLRTGQLKDITSRLEKVESKRHSFDTLTDQLSFSICATKVCSQSVVLSTLSLCEGDNDMVEKPVDPVRVYSERELTKEFEKVAGMLTAEQDWSIRMAAMQRVEGLVFGGATEYACFPLLLKQLVGPLSLQLADRRSSIVKQACHLLNLLSKELQNDFDTFAESFIPMLFKLVVITVLVIAESADTCIKTMLRNSKVARVLPRIIESAKHDRNAVLRARCCEYALLMLEEWSESSEMQRAAELYQELIKCCCGDAMGEVRSTARMCYRVFARCWPDRARRLFQTLDPNIQRLINEEDRGFHKSFSSLAAHDRGSYQQQPLRQSTGTLVAAQPMTGGGSTLPFYENLAKTTNNSSMNLVAGVGAANSSSLSVSKSIDVAPDRTLESVLQASQQQVNAIETMLRGFDTSDKVGGSYRKIHAPATTGPVRLAIDPPSARDPPHPASAPASTQSSSRAIVLAGANSSGYSRSNTSSTLTALSALGGSDRLGLMNVTSRETGGGAPIGVNRDTPRVSAEQSAKRIPMNNERFHQSLANGDYGDGKGAKRVPRLEAQMEKLLADSSFNTVPAYQRPLLRQAGSGRSSGTGRNSNEENQLLVGINSYGEANSYMDGLMTLSDALTEGLSPAADWSARVAAFTYLKKLLQQGPKGLQDVTQSFDKVMKLFFEHLDDPHHKVAQAALSTLAELVPACRKPFEAYLERILPHVFARLVDSKEAIRELGSSTLEAVGNTYSIDMLLPSLLRSLDEQRSPKAKISVIEFAIAAFSKVALTGEASGGSGFLRLWLVKLAPLASDKNPKLKQTATTGLISLYRFDPTTVMNFILGLPIEEQSTLRRALKQYTPRIEVDLMTYLQQRTQRIRPKPGYDQGDGPSTPVEGSSFSSLVGNTQQVASAYLTMSLNSSDGDQKWGATGQAESTYLGLLEGRQAPAIDPQKNLYQSPEPAKPTGESFGYKKSQSMGNMTQSSPRMSTQWSDQAQSIYDSDVGGRHEFPYTGIIPVVNAQSMVNSEPKVGTVTTPDPKLPNEVPLEMLNSKSPSQSPGSSVPNLLHQMSNRGSGKPAEEKQEALEQLILLSRANDSSTWSQYFNQILTVVLESLDDPNSSIRELSLSLIFEMLSNQRASCDEATELLLEKLLHSVRDSDSKVVVAADRCLNTVLMQLDTYRSLTVVVPLLVSEDEKALVICISCLTKLVGRLPSEELMAKLPSFLPVLFDAFGNQNAEVRKTVVFCLVEIYIVLGKAFVPYLGSLSSTQLRLVTIYANRISQARTGMSLETPQM
ncbi:unnamed protein product [Sphagnum balticum]